MFAQLTNHLWQSTLFAAVAALLSVALRRNRAQVRYWLWLTASLKFLVPFAMLMSLGAQLALAPAAKKLATPKAALVMTQITEPFPETLTIAPSAPAATDWKPAGMLVLWACGFACVAFERLRGWRRIRAAIRASAPIDIPAPVPVRSSPGLLEPGVVGLSQPILLIPAGLADRLTPPQLDAVLAHELCHVRRRDNLFASLHMIVEAAFWFHPLVWWIGARLIAERERACDEEVLRQGSAPQVYAEGILNVCKLYVESPLACVSGVTGADLKKRIEAILTDPIVLRLSLAKKAALAVAAVTALAVPVVVGILHTPAVRAQATPKFEVVSIRPGCSGGGGRGLPKSPVPGGRGGKAGGGGPGSSPGRLTACSTLEGYIRGAYVLYPEGHAPTETSPALYVNAVPVSGGPSWTRSDLYQIEAKAEGTPSPEMMRGPMMQALLEERFNLKIRRETRESPAWLLTVAKGGPKLQPFQEGSCIPMSIPPVPPPPGQISCLQLDQQLRRGGTGSVLERHGMKFGEFSVWLFAISDRLVIDNTGITGRYDFHLEFTPDDTTPGALRRLQIDRERNGGQPDAAPDPAGPPLVTAIQQQLGLKLEPVKAPREFLVIDQVERPSGN